MKAWTLVMAAALAAGPALAQSAADLQQLQRLSDERGERMGKYLSTPEGKVRSPVAGRAPQEKVRPMPGSWQCQGADEGMPVYTYPDRMKPGFAVMGRTTGFVATQGTRVGGFLEVLHANGHLGYVPLAAALGDDGRLRPYQAPEGVEARQCLLAGVRVSDGTPVFRFQ